VVVIVVVVAILFASVPGVAPRDATVLLSPLPLSRAENSKRRSLVDDDNPVSIRSQTRSALLATELGGLYQRLSLPYPVVCGVFAAADPAIARSSWSTWHRHHFRTPRRGSRRHLQDPPRLCLPDHAPAVPANVVVVVVVDLVRSCSSLRELHWYCTVSLLLDVRTRSCTLFASRRVIFFRVRVPRLSSRSIQCNGRPVLFAYW